jgi:peptidoglycan hydrolase-like protein with peptidoglycan-binding domain
LDTLDRAGQRPQRYGLPLKAPKASAANKKSTRAPRRGLSKGDVHARKAKKRKKVRKRAEGMLERAGWEAGRVDGRVDKRTRAAARGFQRNAGLKVTGRLDSATRAKLQQVVRQQAKGLLSRGQRSDVVRRLEERLKLAGFDPGKIDRKFDARTARAVRAYKRARKSLKGNSPVAGGPMRARLAREVRHSAAGLPTVTRATAYRNGQPTGRLDLTSIDGKLVSKKVASAFLKMRDAARKDGVDLRINSGFRTMEEQRRLYDGYVRGLPGFNLAARPGYSNHQNGIALDLNTQGTSQSRGTGRVYDWLARNGRRFGFARIAAEHWHWEYKR